MKRKIKIAIDSRPLSMHHTGVALIIKQIVNGLPRGYEVDLVSNTTINTRGIKRDCKQFNLKSKSRFHFEQIALKKYLNKQKPDIYIATWNHGLPLLYSGATKFILVVHDLIPLVYSNIYLNNFRTKKEYLFLLKSSLKKANEIICVSESTRGDLKKFFPKFNYQVVHSTLRELRNKTATVFKKDKYFLYIGGVDPRKKIGKLIEAFAQFSKSKPEYKLCLAGKGMESFLEQINRLGIEDKVNIMDYVDDDKKNELMAKSTALVFPSIKEGFGLPVAEAIINGTAVVCGDDEALREVADGAALYVDSESVYSILNSLQEVIKPEVQHRLRLARSRQQKFLTSNTMSDSYNKVIEDLLNTD